MSTACCKTSLDHECKDQVQENLLLPVPNVFRSKTWGSLITVRFLELFPRSSMHTIQSHCRRHFSKKLSSLVSLVKTETLLRFLLQYVKLETELPQAVDCLSNSILISTLCWKRWSSNLFWALTWFKEGDTHRMMLFWIDDWVYVVQILSGVGLGYLKYYQHWSVTADKMNLKKKYRIFIFILPRNLSRHKHCHFILIMFPYFFLRIMWVYEVVVTKKVENLFAFITIQRRIWGITDAVTLF